DVLDELRLVGRRQRGALDREGGVELVLHATAQVVLRQALVVEDRTELVDQVVVDLLAELVEHRIATLRDRTRTVALLFVETLVEGHTSLSALSGATKGLAVQEPPTSPGRSERPRRGSTGAGTRHGHHHFVGPRW